MHFLKHFFILLALILELKCEHLLPEQFKELLLFEKLLISSTHPKIEFGWSEYVEGDGYESTLLNLLQLEIPFALGNLSLTKFGKDPPIQQVQFSTGYFTCPTTGQCHGIHQSYLAQDLLEIVATKVNFKSVLTPQTFFIGFQLPFLDISNDKFAFVDKHLGTNAIVNRQGLQVFIRNYMITVSADVDSADGIQLKNSWVQFSVDEAKVILGSGTSPGGHVPEMVLELGQDLKEYWKVYEKRDGAIFQSKVNAALANSSCGDDCVVLQYDEWSTKALTHYFMKAKEAFYCFDYHIPRIKLDIQLEGKKDS